MHAYVPLDEFLLDIPPLLNQFPFAGRGGYVWFFYYYDVVMNILIHKGLFKSLG